MLTITNTNDNVAGQDQRLDNSVTNNMSYWIAWAVTSIFLYVLFIFLFEDEVMEAVIVATIINAFSAIITLFILSHGHRRNTYFENFVAANKSRFTLVNYTPLRNFDEFEKAPSCLWSSMHSMGRPSEEADLDREYRVSNTTLRGIADDGKTVVYMGPIKRVGPYGDYWFISIKLTKVFPPVFIDADATGVPIAETNFRHRLRDEFRYDLEGPFANHFTLYAAQPVAVRIATYILTPDIMERVLSYIRQADIELHRSHLYIVWKPQSKDPRRIMNEALGMINSVADPICERAGKYLHLDEAVTPDILKAEMSKTVFGSASETIGYLGGAEARKAFHQVFSRRTLINIAWSVGILVLLVVLFLLYVIFFY